MRHLIRCPQRRSLFRNRRETRNASGRGRLRCRYWSPLAISPIKSPSLSGRQSACLILIPDFEQAIAGLASASIIAAMAPRSPGFSAAICCASVLRLGCAPSSVDRHSGIDHDLCPPDTQKQRPQRGLAGVLYARIPHGRLGGGGLKAPSIVNFEPHRFRNLYQIAHKDCMVDLLSTVRESELFCTVHTGTKRS